MSDVAALADGQWQWSGWLTPKGRVQALFLLLRVDPETVWLVLPDGDAAGLKAAMERFVFRSKVRLSLPDGLAPCASFSAPAAASGAMSATDARGRVELDLGDGTTARTLRICSGCPAPVDQDALARWRAFDLVHGVPRPGAGAGALEAWTPQQLSLERLKAYSVRKGCYPGQEIVARTHFLGQAKRGLALFGSDAVPPAGAQVMDGERALGNVVAAAPSAGHGGPDAGASGAHAALVLAVLPVERPDGSPALTVDDHALVPLPLLDGLAR